MHAGVVQSVAGQFSAQTHCPSAAIHSSSACGALANWNDPCIDIHKSEFFLIDQMIDRQRICGYLKEFTAYIYQILRP